MKKAYRKPLLALEIFIPQEYCSPCGNGEAGWYVDVGNCLAHVYFDQITDTEPYTVGYFQTLEDQYHASNPTSTIPENPPYFTQSPREVWRNDIKIYKTIDYDNGVQDKKGFWHYPYKDLIEHLYEIEHNGIIYYFEKYKRTGS